MSSITNTFADLKAYTQSMIDFTKAEMDATAEDWLEFYLAAGGITHGS